MLHAGFVRAVELAVDAFLEASPAQDLLAVERVVFVTGGERWSTPSRVDGYRPWLPFLLRLCFVVVEFALGR